MGRLLCIEMAIAGIFGTELLHVMIRKIRVETRTGHHSLTSYLAMIIRQLTIQSGL